ncbi:MAG TPA: preprotein translocase subunit SecA [Dehalococcoidia bacterium]|nr:preprotein translocase subunit SecA [Dehalococcoidia bacterium]
MVKFLSKFLDSNEKELKRLQPYVDRINALEPEYEKLSDADLRAKTDQFKKRHQEGTSLDDLLPEAFAAVREAARRTLGQRHFDVQLIGGVALHQGKIAEMKTGEGKTLVATLPLYLNSLTGRGVHLVTVNDYLARRDPYWMGPIYHALGVSVVSIYPMQNPDEHTPARLYDPDYDSDDARWPHFKPISRKEAYQADVVYGTSSDFGFDYLRDNMVVDLSQAVQRELYYAIVDEADNLLIDEARTPLIISAPAEESGEIYQVFARIVPRLRAEEDYSIDAKSRTVSLTENGMNSMEKMLRREGLLKSPNLYDPENHVLTRYLDNALKAQVIYKRDREYVVEPGGEVVIVDEFTGRKMYGRRYSDGLHQAIEAKEHVKIQRESMTYATITIQNYFRMYEKLAGMTGTAATEAEEFHKIYKLEVTEIPTNEPMIREDLPDQIYKTEEGKFRAVVNEIKKLHDEGLPVLVGTVSIEKSEYLSDLLKRQGIACKVLNAKEHTREGEIIARAGEPGAVTVATNMAGRGVDILLGGSHDAVDEKEWQRKHDEIIEKGGLQIIGTERHDARRIDNQLRGRSGRQGDPGRSRFFLSLEDDIVKRFGGDRLKGIMGWAGMDEETPIENAVINRLITDVQKRVEGYHFDIRKHLVEYDDVVNKHRELIYEERRKILGGADLKSNILDMVSDEIRAMVNSRLGNTHGLDWDIPGLLVDIGNIFPLPRSFDPDSLVEMKPGEIAEKLIEAAGAYYEEKEKEIGADRMRMLERLVMLQVIDRLWVEHLTQMEHERLQAGWAGLRQMKSTDAYRSSGYAYFEQLKENIRHDIARTIFHVRIQERGKPPTQTQSPMAAASLGSKGDKKPVKAAGSRKIGRNDPCPCGSGKKYKHCCGR